MKKFEIGKQYYESGLTYEITGRTAKTVKYVEIQHAGKPNERRSEEKKAKINVWGGGEFPEREVFYTAHRNVEA